MEYEKQVKWMDFPELLGYMKRKGKGEGEGIHEDKAMNQILEAKFKKYLGFLSRNSTRELVALYKKETDSDVKGVIKRVLEYRLGNEGRPNEVRLLIGTSNDDFYKAIQDNDLELVSEVLRDGWLDPSGHDNFAIRLAASLNNPTNMIEVLMTDKRVDPSTHDNVILKHIWNKTMTGVIGPDLLSILMNDQRILDKLDPVDREMIETYLPIICWRVGF